MITQEDKERIGPALGRVPSGVFILIAGDGSGRQTGMLASWVQQASFEPPQVTVAVNRSRYLNDWLAEGSSVTINQVAKGDNVLFRHFGKGFEPDQNAFEGLDTSAGDCGLPLLNTALASMEGTVLSQMSAGDHIIYLVKITTATSPESSSDREPFVHVRKNGFSY
ncbi:MAG: flavin reductase family protein [Fuerstiella sp.]